MPPPDKYPRTPYSPWSAANPHNRPAPDMTRFVGQQIVITEKLDGSNTLLRRGQACPRSADSASASPWLAMARKHHAWKTIPLPDLQLYGEDIYGVHAIEYDSVPENATFRLFAARENDAWLSWDAVAALARKLDILTVPVLHRGTPETLRELRREAEALMRQPSAIGPEKEGIIIRIAGSFPASEFDRSVCKMVRPGHVQPADDHWSNRWRPCSLLPAAELQTSKA